MSADGNVVVGRATTPGGQEVAYRVELNSPVLLGDMNCDGVVSVGDIAGFVLALTARAEYLDTYPGCHPYNADCDQNGLISVTDIGRFVELLAPR